jgi:hypothetical protein
MTDYLNTDAQDKFYEVLSPILHKVFRTEYITRSEKAESEVKNFATNDEVKQLRTNRQTQFDLIVKFSEMHKEIKDDNEKKVFISFLGTYGAGDDLRVYNVNEELFTMTYNKDTDRKVERLQLELAQKENGVDGISQWSTETKIRESLKARLAVCPTDKYEAIIAKVTTEFDINQYFNN